MPHRRNAQSSALSFIDCICCGFGAVLLLFILTAKHQISQTQTDATQALAAHETLQQAIEAAEAQQRALAQQFDALDPQPDSTATDIAALAAKQARLAQAIEDTSEALSALETETETVDAVAGLKRPSADQSYLSGLQLRGPRAVIVLENSGSMLADSAGAALDIIRAGSGDQADKWLRAKAAVRAVLAAIPQGTQVAIFQMNETTTALSGSPQSPYIDPYDNASLLATLERLDTLQATGAANLAKAFSTLHQLKQGPSSLLLIGDGLPTAPNPNHRSLSEAERVQLFKHALAKRPAFPFNAILLPFAGDPSAAGLFWKLSARSNGITLIPHQAWPAR